MDPIVCLHAIGHDASDWDQLAARLPGRVIALDWPGHGAAPHDGVAPSSTHYAGVLRQHLDRLGIARAVLIGNSIGGATALRFAADHPERVSALVLANPGGLDRRGVLLGFACRMMSRFFAAGARGAWWYPRLFGAYYKMVLPLAPVERARITARWREIAPLLRDAWAGFARPEEDLRAHAARLRCPTLVAWAVRDRFVQLSRSRAAISTIPRHMLRTFRAGHAPQLETPDAFAEAVSRFLAAEAAEHHERSLQDDVELGGQV